MGTQRSRLVGGVVAAALVLGGAAGGVVAAVKSAAPTPHARLLAASSSSLTITITAGACSGGGTTFCFKPESAIVGLGVPVVWTNQSGVGHTASSCTAAACPGAPANTGSNTFSVSIGAPAGSTGTFTFSSAGVYTYYCMIHGYSLMHGKITVVKPPAITGFSPQSGAPGTQVTISGSNLAHARSVKFGGVKGTIDSDSASKIVATVPTSAVTGHISVRTPGGTATSSGTFTVT